MSNEQTPRPENGQSKTNAGDTWQDVGKQFQALGESLATALRATWNDEHNRKRVQEMQNGVESMLNEVGKAIDETAKSPHMQQAKTEAQKAAESLRVASEQTMQDVRPHLVSALRQLNDELQKLVGRLEQSKSAAEAKPAEPTEPPTDTTPTA